MAKAVKVKKAGGGYTVVVYDDGSIVRRKGHRNWRNYNPGNIEYGPFAKRHGAIGTDGRFAVFPDYQTGRKAKESLLFNSGAYKDKTIKGAIKRYAPPIENNTAAYYNNIAKAAGVAPDTKLSDLSPMQRSQLLNAMEKVEGFKVGTVKAEKGKVPAGTLGAGGAQTKFTNTAGTIDTLPRPRSIPISLGIEQAKAEKLAMRTGGLLSPGLPKPNPKASPGLFYHNRAPGTVRNRDITGTLEGNIRDAVRDLYGPGSKVSLYSGGQPGIGEEGRRVGTIRHDHGKAGDVYVFGPDGKKVTGKDLAPLGQYWRAKNLGGVGLEMAGGGIHLDEHVVPPNGGGMDWHYGSPQQAHVDAFKAGARGEMPPLYVRDLPKSKPSPVSSLPDHAWNGDSLTSAGRNSQRVFTDLPAVPAGPVERRELPALEQSSFTPRLEFDPGVMGGPPISATGRASSSPSPVASASGAFSLPSQSPTERVNQAFGTVRPEHFKERYLRHDMSDKAYQRLARDRVEKAFDVAEQPSAAVTTSNPVGTAHIQAPERANRGMKPLSLLDLSGVQGAVKSPDLGPVDPNLVKPQAPIAPQVQAPQLAPPQAPQPITQPVMNLPRPQPGAPGSILPLGARPGPANPTAIKAAQRLTRGLTTGIGGAFGGPIGAIAGNLIGRRLDDRAGRETSNFLSGGVVGASGHTYARGSNIHRGLDDWNRTGKAGNFWNHNDDLDNIAQQAWDRERAASGATQRKSLGDILSRDFGSGSGGVSWW